MKIVIAGAGSIGYHLAKLLATENQDIILIDSDEDVLNQAGSKLDLLTVHGNAEHISTLREAEIHRANIFIAVTTSETTNLLSAILAKQLGAKLTVARVSDEEYLDTDQRQYFKKIGVDSIFSPHYLASQEIERLITRASLTDTYDFEGGQISIVGFTVDSTSLLVGKPINCIDNMINGAQYRGVALLRNHITIIPKSSTLLQKGDHLYLSLPSNTIAQLTSLIGKESKPIKKIMIVGETSLALSTAQRLENSYDLTVVISHKKKANNFLKLLKNTLITVGKSTDLDFLISEGIMGVDAFIALTPDSEINILSCLIAEDHGVYKTIAHVGNEVYTHISQSIGVDTIINKKLIAANNIFRHVRKGKIEAITAMHGVNAEIIEFNVTRASILTRKRLFELKLPLESTIAAVIRETQVIIPKGDFVINVKDRVIVLVMPSAIKRIEKLFN